MVSISKFIVESLFFARFSFVYKVYCAPNYYTSDCSVYCEGRDDYMGHYTCDQETGQEVCLPGEYFIMNLKDEKSVQ